jgi:hypothetical protein
LAEANGYEFKVKIHSRPICGAVWAKMQKGFSQKIRLKKSLLKIKSA